MPEEPENPEGHAAPTGDVTSKVFSQDEVNAMMGRVRQEERGKYADYGKLKERAKVADELEKAKMTEAEKTAARLAEAERRAIDSDARIADTAIKAEIRLRAVQKGIVDPDAAYALADRTGIAYDDDGVKGVDEALDALIAAKPYLKAHALPPNLNPGGSPGAVPVKLTDAERVAARRFGLTEEQYAANKVAK